MDNIHVINIYIYIYTYIRYESYELYDCSPMSVNHENPVKSSYPPANSQEQTGTYGTSEIMQEGNAWKRYNFLISTLW